MTRTVAVDLVANVGRYQSSMVQAATATRAVGDQATTAGAKAQRGFDMAGRGAAVLGGVLAGGLALGLKRTVDLAATAEQSIGGVEAVFKDYAKTVIADSQDADRALGLSANAYRELATIIGSQLKNAGVPMDELAAKTDDLITIGADLAAQFGGTTQEAVQALSSALRGELDPIERYGISLSAAAVGAKAVELGLSESATELDQNAKLMATLAIVTEQSADAQGAFGRESDTAAGRAQRAAAQWENLQTAIGEKLLPAWSALMDFVGTTVIPGLETVGGAIGTVGGFMADNEGLALALATALGIHLAGGITAVTVAFNRLVLTNAVIGLSNMLGVVLDLPAALRSASAATASFIAAAAPLAAAGGVIYAFTEFAANAAAVEERLAAAADAGSDFYAVLAANDGAINSTTREAAMLAVEAAGLAEAFDDAGVSSRTVTEALAGNKRAFEEALAAARELDAETSLIGNSWGLLGVTMDVVSGRATENADALRELAGVHRVGRVDAGAWGDAVRAAGEAAEGSAPAVDSLEAELAAVAEAADEAKKQTDMFKLSLDILTGATVSMIQVESAFQAAVAEAEGAMEGLNGTVLDGAGDLNLQSEAGRAASAVLLDVRDSGNQLIATMIQQGATAEEVLAADRNLRESFIRSAQQMGISREAAEKLADQILGIPSERETKIKADTAEAARRISGIQGQLDGLRDKTVTIKTVYTQSGSFSGNTRAMTPGLAFGGPVPGSSPSDRADNVPIMATAGEFMQPRPAVRKYGMGFMEDVRTGRFPVELARGYADGGPIVQINLDRSGLSTAMEAYANAKDATRYVAGYATPSGGGSLGSSYTSLFAAVQRAFPQARLNSGFRPGDPGYHGRGKAADIGLMGVAGGAGNSFMASVNQWLYDNHKGSLAELIYDGLGDNRPDVKNSRDLTYSAATQADHRNHVHAAVYDSGGPLYPGLTLAYNGTGSTEWVTRSREFGGSGSGTPSVHVAAPSLVGMTIQGRVTVDGDGIATIAGRVVDQAIGSVNSQFAASGVR